MTNSGWPNSTGSPFLARMDTTRPALSRLDLVHHLHGLDDAEHVARLHLGADLDERLRARRRRGVERADHRRGHRLVRRCAGWLPRRARRRPRAGAPRAAAGRRRRRVGDRRLERVHRPGRMPADADGLLAFLDLDFGDARLLEQLDQFLDLANVHSGIPRICGLSGVRRAAGRPRYSVAARSASS